MKILTIIGARPQFVKAAVLSREIRQRKHIQEVLVHTGQHYDNNMSDVFFEEMDIPQPQYHLDIGAGHHGEQTGKMLIEIEKVVLEEKPDWLLVYGDTNSTLAGALVASKLHIPLAHVEAGLRSFDKKMPEEVNRIMTDHVSDVLFCPTEVSKNQLISEGISEDKIKIVGDVMYDASMYYLNKSQKQSKLLQKLSLENKKYVMVTIHRPSNTDDKNRLGCIVKQLEELAEEVEVVLPIHPRTKKQMNLFGFSFERVKVIDPLGYLDIVTLEANAALVITDSGGVQKEAYFHQVPCLTLRNETEWIELLKGGHNVLVSDLSEIKIIAKEQIGRELDFSNTLYGELGTAQRILDCL